ncbi:hypothetical protein DL89DRAFT_303911, partial [Linderina pennispora]
MDDIHAIVQQHKLSVEQSRIVLKGYYSAWSLLEAHQQLPDVRLPALFSSPSLKTIAQFGGQSGAPNFMDDAAWLFDVYHPLLSDFVEYMSRFLHQESMDLVLDGTLEQPLDFVGWLLKPETAPATQHLHAAPIAFPFIGLFQLMHLVVLYKTLRIDPGELTTLFRGAIGHSIGIHIAAAFASVTDQDSLYGCAEKALGILLAAGWKMQAGIPLSHVSKAILDDELEHGGHPSPMAAFSLLPQNRLQQFIDDFNQGTNSADSKVRIGAYQRTFCVCCLRHC